MAEIRAMSEIRAITVPIYLHLQRYSTTVHGGVRELTAHTGTYLPHNPFKKENCVDHLISTDIMHVL
jgi:hypothetical protein